jgi:hypothetical protein
MSTHFVTRVSFLSKNRDNLKIDHGNPSLHSLMFNIYDYVPYSSKLNRRINLNNTVN